MPTYEYVAVSDASGCDHCRRGFDHVAKATDPALRVCPKCGEAVRRVYSAPAVGRSQSGFDDRAKRAGFHKMKRLGKGEYEKQY